MTAPSSTSAFVLDPAVDKKVDDLAKSIGIEKAELLRRALALYSVLQSLSPTGHILVEEPTTGSKLSINLDASRPST
jgi:hypothetical protein